ncbi:MAG: hypothetical protein N5P05_002971 [Chroococcopsis gigantea SAG 12.99]|jgi:spoIIIJ-associated protein|nr:RNA-binding protein [Chlorogloea purpurea SAG 13.99]MDV3001365.1 hypothetical protein [Chroococcopsis gigantea SAG 12.99]
MREQQKERGKEWLETLLNLMGLPAEVTLVDGDSMTASAADCWLNINEANLSREQVELLTGPKGESLDAIQYLANTILNITAEPQDHNSFTVELNGYRLKRQSELLAIANRIAEQVRATGQEVEIKSLSSAERRQMHTFFQNEADLATESRGQEPDRRLIVRLR